MKVYVGGVNAVGKSTLTKAVAEKLGYRYIHATSGLLDSLGFGKDYEKLRALSQEERDIEYRKYIECLLDGDNKNFFLDAHYLGLVRGKVDRVTDSWLEGFDVFALISAPLDTVWERIENDSKSRDRALFPPDASTEERRGILANFQNQTFVEFSRLSQLYSKPCIEIHNEENGLEQGVESLASFIKDI